MFQFTVKYKEMQCKNIKKLSILWHFPKIGITVYCDCPLLPRDSKGAPALAGGGGFEGGVYGVRTKPLEGTILIPAQLNWGYISRDIL